MRQRLEARKLLVEKTSIACKVTEQDVKKKEDHLSTEVRSLLVGGTTLSIAKSKLQVLSNSMQRSFLRNQYVSLLHFLQGQWCLAISNSLFYVFLCFPMFFWSLFFDRRTVFIFICILRRKFSSFNCFFVLLWFSAVYSPCYDQLVNDWIYRYSIIAYFSVIGVKLPNRRRQWLCKSKVCNE